MFANLSKIPIKLGILLVGFGLLVGGCDSAGPNANNNGEDFDISYEATGDLEDRITSFESSSSNAAALAKESKSISFEVTHRVSPPDIVSQNERASHLAFANDNLYVGYKVLNDNYGGGIDILDASGDSLAASANTNADALVVEDVDIQEIAVKEDGSGNPSALLAATAISRTSFQRPPQLHSITLSGSGFPDSDVSYDAIELAPPSGSPLSRVGKSVVSSPSGTYGAFTTSDQSIHAVQTSSNGQTIQDTTAHPTSNGQFRSVVDTENNGVFALTSGGGLYSYTSSGLNTSSPLNNFGNLDSDLGIARLSSHNFTNGDEFLFASLVGDGFRVVDPSSGSVVFSDSDITATSVTVTDDYLFVAGGDGFAVYSIDGDDPTDGISDIGRASINELVGGNSASSAQVNHILASENGSGDIVLYVAKSYDGVYRLQERDDIY